KVTSEVGQGTSFQVRLGLSKVERPRAHIAAAAAVTGYDGPRKTLMVVDDNQDHRALMRELLAPLGFDILLVESGEACLEMIAAMGAEGAHQSASDHASTNSHPPDAPHPPAVTNPPAVTLGLDPRALHLPDDPQVQSPRVKPEG